MVCDREGGCRHDDRNDGRAVVYDDQTKDLTSTFPLLFVINLSVGNFEQD